METGDNVDSGAVEETSGGGDPEDRGREPTRHSGGQAPGVDSGRKVDDGSGEGDKKEAGDKGDKAKKTRARKVKHRGEEVDFDPDDDESVEQLVQRLSKKHRVKVDGEEQEIEYDDLIKDYQRSALSSKRTQEADRVKQYWQKDLPQRLRSDHNELKRFFTDTLGYSDWMDPLLNELHEIQRIESLNQPDPNLSDEENARRQLEFQRIQYQRAEQSAQQKIQREMQERQRQQEEHAVQERARQLAVELPEAFQSRGLDYEEFGGLVGPTAQRLRAAGEEATPETIAHEINRSMRAWLARAIPKEPAELLDLLGDDRMKALRKHLGDAEKKRIREEARGQGSGQSTPTKSSNSSRRKRNTGTVDDLF